MTDGFQTTDQLVPVLTTDELMDKAAAMGSVIALEQHRQRQREPRRILPHATLRENLAEERAQTERNIRNVAAANWWHAQGAEQRGDHVAAAQHGIARGRLLAAAKAEGLTLGH